MVCYAQIHVKIIVITLTDKYKEIIYVLELSCKYLFILGFLIFYNLVPEKMSAGTDNSREPYILIISTDMYGIHCVTNFRT